MTCATAVRAPRRLTVDRTRLRRGSAKAAGCAGASARRAMFRFLDEVGNVITRASIARKMKLGSKRPSSKDVRMTVPANGLNAKLDWFAVIDCLDLYRDSQALPQRTACLQCGSVEHLVLFEDFEGGDRKSVV